MKKITLSIALMAHPKRADMVEELLSRLDRSDVRVVWDEKNSRWDTGKRSMLAFDPKCSHHAVIQDDVLVCRDLFAGLTKALAHVPDNVPVCGYVGRVRPLAEQVSWAAHVARVKHASWLTMHTLNWGPLIAVPTYLIPAMIEHCDKLDHIPNYDRRLSRFFELNEGVPTWYTWPSLVDHADGPSLVPGRIGTNRAERVHTRVAHNFIGEDASALDVNWSGLSVDGEAALPERIVYCNVVTGEKLYLRPTSPRVRRLRGLPSWKLVTEGVKA